MGNLFGTTNKTTTNSTNSSTNSGQTNSNFMPQLQEAYSALQRQYSNLGDMGANPWQTGAADAQMGVAGNLQPAYSAAGQVAQGGIGDVSRYMSPYISNVVDATRADFAAQNARDLSNVGAQAAKLGSVTGTGRTGALLQAKESQRRTQDPVIASLYNQGFAQSGQLAQADAASRISGANSIGSLTGVNTQANLGLGALGQQAQQSNLAPYTLANQYAGATAGLAGQAGTNYTGQSSGQTNSTQTQQQNQGIGTIAAGLVGSALMGGFNPMSMFSTGRSNTIPGTAANGGWTTSWSRGGAVNGDADGDGIVDRYQRTIASLHRMHGGSIPGLARGGAVDDDLPHFQAGARVTEETTNIEPRPQVGMPYNAPEPEAPRMDLGGPRAQPQQSSGFDFSGLIPTFSEGVWKGEKPSPMQTFGYALTQVGRDNPFAGFGSAAFNQYNEEARRRQQSDLLAKQLDHQARIASGIGHDGAPTIAAQQLQESQRQHDKPTWGVIGQNEFGQPTYGWINPNLAPNFSSRSPGAASVMPGETQGSVIPSNAAPGFKGGDMSKTGDEFLASLDDQTARLVKGIAEGRVQPPGSFALSKPYWQHMTRMVSQYDPTFDGTSWSARSKTANDFSAGKSAQNITSFNTAIGHLDSLDKAIAGLDNSRFPWWNSLSQSARVQGGDAKYAEKLKAFQTAKTAVTDELVRAFRGSGGNVHDIIQWEKNINAADSPEALRGSVRSAIELLRSRIEAMGDTYNRGMGANKDPMAWLSPKSRHALERIEMEGRASDAPEQKGVTQGYAAGQGTPKAVTDRLGQPGQSANNPVEVESAEQARTLGSGTWVRRRADGKILQVP